MCEHNNFKTQCNVFKLTDEEGNPTGMTVDITIACADCFKPLEFIGLPGGINPNYPTVSADGLEARMPVKLIS